MIIYDDVKKNTKIAVFSEHGNILDEVINLLIDDGFNVEEYIDIDDLKTNVKKYNIKIVLFLYYDKEKIKSIREDNDDVIIILLKSKKDNKIDHDELKSLKIQHVVSINRLNVELMNSIKLIAQEENLDFQKFKLDIVASLVESISHQIQANLLLVGASLDVIKMLAEDEDISKNNQRKDVLNNLYEKNSNSLQKANMLLQLMSDATNISSESIMQYDDIIEIIKLILDEYIKQNNTILKVQSRIKNGSYICGPLNDIIFVVCKIIKSLIMENIVTINLLIREDELKWFFDISVQESLKTESIIKICKYMLYIKGIKYNIQDKKIIIEIKKIK